MDYSWLFCSGTRNSNNPKLDKTCCSKKLLRYSMNTNGTIEIKCVRCGTINEVFLAGIKPNGGDIGKV